MSKHLPDMYYLEAVRPDVDDVALLLGKVFKTPLSAIRYLEQNGWSRMDFECKPIEIIFYPSNVEADFRVAGPPHDK